MRKSWILLATLAPLSALAGLALPALAASVGGPAVNQPAAGPLDLDKIPVKPVAGRLSVRGVGGDDESDDNVRGPHRESGNGIRSHIGADDDDGPSGSRDSDD